MSADDWIAIFTAVVAVATVVQVVIFIWTQRRGVQLQERLNWFTGAMAANAQKSTIIQAKEAGIIPVWWDPTMQPWPPTGPHNTEIETERMYFGMRPGERKTVPPTWERYEGWGTG